MKKICKDFYGERLKVGDEVIPAPEETLFLNISGVISNISYNEEDDNYYITISDKEGHVLMDGVNAECYTTKTRVYERENRDFVYELTFYNEDFKPICTLPLTNKTDENYEIPDGTCLVTICSEHLQSIEKYSDNPINSSSKRYSINTIGYFIVDGKYELCFNQNDVLHTIFRNFYNYTPAKCLFNSKTGSWLQISDNCRLFKDEEELKRYIKSIIEYFNSADLTYVNKDTEIDKNEEGRNFERKLINRLKN